MFGLHGDGLQTFSGQEVEDADLSIRAAGQQAEEEQSQRFNLPARRPAAVLVTDKVISERPPQGGHLEDARGAFRGVNSS